MTQKGEREEALYSPSAIEIAEAVVGRPDLHKPSEALYRIARALLAASKAGSPIAGYDQLGKAHYCLECGKHWYGDVAPCDDEACPFKPKDGA